MAQDDVRLTDVRLTEDIAGVLSDLRHTLLEKNLQYGDSVLNPLRILSKADPMEQIRVRIDDKLSRLARGSGDQEDTILDLLGYLVMLRIAMRRKAESK